jgi:hypothetical protein
MKLENLPEWQRIILDVCGFKRPDRGDKITVFVSHLHRDHKAHPADLKGLKTVFQVPPEYVDSLTREYAKRYKNLLDVEVSETTDVICVPHTSYNPVTGRYETVNSYAHFIRGRGSVLYIPECDDPRSLIREYRPKVVAIATARRKKRFQLVPWDFEEVDYLVDNKVWFWESPPKKVIPKVLFSLSPEDIELRERLVVREKSFLWKCTHSFK